MLSFRKILMVIACICTFLFALTPDANANEKAKVWVKPLADSSNVYLYDITLDEFERLLNEGIPSKLSESGNFFIIIENNNHLKEFCKIINKMNIEFKEDFFIHLKSLGVIDPDHLRATKQYGFSANAIMLYLSFLPVDLQ